MAVAYTSRTVKTMDEATKDKITNAGVPLEIYTNGYANLGASNGSSLGRMAEIAKQMIIHDLPIPPSPMIEFIADRTTGPSKLDFSEALDGKKGSGKSRTSIYKMCRYAMEVAERTGGDPKDYFSLDNVALLEDTEAITRILEEAELHQGILIDDGSTAVGSRDFATQKNKNFNKILTVCRTKRWYVLLNVPVITHIDLQIRELIDAKSRVYKSFHTITEGKSGFNILKTNSSDIASINGKNKQMMRRFSFYKKKFDFWVAFSSDRLDTFKGIVPKYEALRDEAAIRLISETASEEKAAKNPVSRRDVKKQEMFTEHYEKVREIFLNNPNVSARSVIRSCPGLTLQYLEQMRAQGGF